MGRSGVGCGERTLEEGEKRGREERKDKEQVEKMSKN